VVLKAARGGYDGKGVWPVRDETAAAAVLAAAAERRGRPARRPGGDVAVWPAVDTTQTEGVCREVLVHNRLDLVIAESAVSLARRVATEVELVGVMAVELFLTEDQLLVNEIAARPHNSGHWTIEGAVTSQFENHLRAVLDLPLGDTSRRAPCVASVNVFGPADGSDPRRRLGDALAVRGAHVHLYGKHPRPGRKLGHVTVCGSDLDDVRTRAWAAASALGTPTPHRSVRTTEGAGR
jgi:5-(carboxyamino)imidazole ribonucleotide synthase